MLVLRHAPEVVGDGPEQVVVLGWQLVREQVRELVEQRLRASTGNEAKRRRSRRRGREKLVAEDRAGRVPNRGE